MARVLLDGLRLVDPAVQDLGTPGMTPVLAIERALEVLLRQCFMETFSDILIKPPSVKIHSMYFKQRFASLPALLGTNHETWYPEITVATRPEDSFDDVDLASSSMDLVPIIYGGGISRIFLLKKKTAEAPNESRAEDQSHQARKRGDSSHIGPPLPGHSASTSDSKF
ncbi:hypothetical protein ACM1PE_23335 [Achromobacter sp. PD1]|jgi:hypothetical protein|uniref:hypothetical protein n=1 Tax=Achromobacter sp. PD1 TaxID=3399125 RepID=UPI003AF6E054